MSSTSFQAGRKKKSFFQSITIPKVVRLGLLVILDSAIVWLLLKLVGLGYYPFAAAILVITLIVNIIMLRKEAYPLRWMVVGFIFMGLFTIYPIIFTIWVAFTNYGEGHLITKEQAIAQFEEETYLPETGKAYSWTAFKAKDGTYALWLLDETGNAFLAKVGEPLTQPKAGEMGVGELDAKGIPVTIEGYQRLNAILAATDKNLTNIKFGEAGTTIQVRSPSEAAELVPMFVYDSTQDAMVNQETGTS